MRCRQQKILLVPSTYATCSGQTGNLQALNLIYITQNTMRTCFKFVRSHKL